MLTELDPSIDFDVDMNNLDEEFRRLPRYINEYSSLYAQAVHVYSMAKKELVEVQSIVKKELINNSDKKPPDSVLEIESNTHPTVMAAKVSVIDAEKDMHTVKAHCTAMNAKKDMLIQIGANARKEL